MNEIIIPKKLQPIVKAFFAESEDAAKALIIQSCKTIYSGEYNKVITKEELQGVCALMQSFKPQDALEALFAAQIVVSHMLGMHKLSKMSLEEQRLGLKMLQFSSEALGHLQKKRSGGMQNITVNYNYSGSAPAHPSMTIPLKEIEHAD